MKNTHKIAALAAFLSLVGATAQAEPKYHDGLKEITRAEALERAAERFDRADTNGDGTLTGEEMRAGMKKERGKKKGDRKGPKDHFDKIDADNSGTISLDEFKAAAEKMHKRKPDDAPKRDKVSAKKVFQHLDVDDSGDLSKEEMKAGKHKGKHGGRKQGPRPTQEK